MLFSIFLSICEGATKFSFFNYYTELLNFGSFSGFSETTKFIGFTKLF